MREGMRGVMLDTHVYLVMAEQFPLFRLIPDRWLMGWYRLFVRWNERRIRRAVRYTPVIVGEWCVANGLVNRVVDKRTGDGGRSKENAMHSASIRGSIYREVAAMQRKAWNVSAGQIYWSYQLRGNHDFLPTIDPQSDTDVYKRQHRFHRLRSGRFGSEPAQPHQADDRRRQEGPQRQVRRGRRAAGLHLRGLIYALARPQLRTSFARDMLVRLSAHPRLRTAHWAVRFTARPL